MTTLVENTLNDVRERLGLSSNLTAVDSGMLDIFENGVMATVRVGAERFGFGIRLSSLGLIPTREKSREKTQAAIDAVLRGAQRASLLPRDQMWYMENGEKKPIPRPENSERHIRMLFPTKYEDVPVSEEETGTPSKAKSNQSISAPSLWAIPLNGMTFIPEASFDKWKSDFEKAKADHLRTASIIVDNYVRLRASSVRHYERIALDVYNRLLQTSPETLGGVPALEFTRRWRRAVLRAWPTREEISRNFTVDARFFWVPLPSRVETDLVKAKEVRDLYEEGSERRRASYAIRSVVEETQKGQVHDLTVSYIKTILERTEHVFIGFLSFLDERDRNPSPKQLKAILKVVDMIKVLGKDVSSFDQICDQAKVIEESIEQIKRLQVVTKKDKSVTGKRRDVDTKLPTALADAVRIMRIEAEMLIGNEARRTVYTNQDPHQICDAIFSGIFSKQDSERGRLINEDWTEDESLDNFSDSLIVGEEKSFRLVRTIED